MPKSALYYRSNCLKDAKFARKLKSKGYRVVQLLSNLNAFLRDRPAVKPSALESWLINQTTMSIGRTCSEKMQLHLQ